MSFLSLVPPPYFNTAQYGTKGDGIQDDTSFIAQALAALPSTGGTILLPQGTYKVTSTIAYQMLTNQHVIIQGQGNVTIVSTLSEPAQENGIFAFTGDGNGSTTPTSRLTIRNITLQHSASAQGLLDGIFIQPTNYGSTGTMSIANLRMDSVKITGVSKFGCRLLGVMGGVIENCTMTGNYDSGCAPTGCQDLTIIGGNYSNNVSGLLNADYGISISSSSFLPYSKNILIQGVQANGNGRKGIDVHHGRNIHIIGNTCIGNGYSGIYAVAENSTKDVADITIMGNTIDQTGGNATLPCYAINVGTFGTTGALSPGAFIVTGNKVYGVDSGASASAGVRVMTATTGVAPERVVISNNTFEHGSGPTGWCIETDSTLPIEHLEIVGNTLHTTQCAYGIIVQSAVDVVCQANTLRVDTSGGGYVYGISIASSANALVSGNQINGATPALGPITNSSSTHLLRANQANGIETAPTSQIAPFTVASGLTVDALGHLLAIASGTPTFTGVNANIINQTITGNDVRGVIQFDVQTSTISASTNLFTVNFANAYGSAPVVVLSNASNQTTSEYYVQNVGTSTFIVRNQAILGVLTSYKINYIVIG